MGIWDAFSDLVEAVTPWSVVEAEAPAEESKEEQAPEADAKSEDTEESEEATEESSEEAEGEGEGGDDDEEEEEEEDDEDEIVNPQETLEEECKQSAQCAPAKHHFDDCVERVQQQDGDDEAKEDCVEEFFHLAHCATACAAPRLWSKLK